MIGQTIVHKFNFFFNDSDTEFEANRDIIIGIVKELNPLVVLKGEYLQKKG